MSTGSNVDSCTKKAVCDVCGTEYGDAADHEYGSEWKSDAETHWHECTCGKKVEQASHVSTGSNVASCTKKAICDVCGTEYGNVANHEYGSEWKSDAEAHWHECTCGEKAEQASHVSTGSNVASCTKKAVCDVCGTEYGDVADHEYGSEWKSDAETHWHACVCGDKVDISAHAWDAGIVTRLPQKTV